MSSRYPLRLTPDQRNELKEHYEDDPGEEKQDWTKAPVDAIPFPGRDLEYEKWLDDHDRLFMDQYDTREGDSGENDSPF